MTFETFTPPVAPSPGTGRKTEYKVLEAEFGDGYSQPVGDGINYRRRSISLVWNALTDAQADQIIDFLEPRTKVTPFLFQAPRTTSPSKWTCDDWTDDLEPGRRRITATFKESFLLG